jgi:chromate reductase, NAD(P)H dehydrogenase (quinone)
MRILAVCGSLQAESANLTLLRVAASKVPTDVEFVLFDGIRNLPNFDPDLEARGVPLSVSEWRQALSASDAVMIASPEYGHSLPGSLKNAIDWVIGSAELERKIVAVTASTPAADRGRRGLRALCDTLGAVSARIVSGEPIVRGASFEAEVGRLVDELVAEMRRPPG